MDSDRFELSRDGHVNPGEIMALRSTTTSVPWQIGTEDLWASCIQQSLCVVTVRERTSGDLVGVGFLVGNARHAQLVDMAVHPRVSRQGIGRALQLARLQFAREREIPYIGLTWNRAKPWQHDFYESNGFRDIDFAMWHEESVRRTQQQPGGGAARDGPAGVAESP